MIGDTKLPNSIPNLNQALFSGVKILEFNNPKIKKIMEIIIDQTLISPSLKNRYIDIIRKNRKKTIPKLLFELVFISFFCKIKLTMVV
jgi:hypothetical protein|tara:strand:- start:54 stop:317 length:264 start_codon:yes stop_codon:yes gene_type:complete